VGRPGTHTELPTSRQERARSGSRDANVSPTKRVQTRPDGALHRCCGDLLLEKPPGEFWSVESAHLGVDEVRSAAMRRDEG